MVYSTNRRLTILNEGSVLHFSLAALVPSGCCAHTRQAHAICTYGLERSRRASSASSQSLLAIAQNRDGQRARGASVCTMPFLLLARAPYHTTRLHALTRPSQISSLMDRAIQAGLHPPQCLPSQPTSTSPGSMSRHRTRSFCAAGCAPSKCPSRLHYHLVEQYRIRSGRSHQDHVTTIRRRRGPER
jgi:hypothetical protein